MNCLRLHMLFLWIGIVASLPAMALELSGLTTSEAALASRPAQQQNFAFDGYKNYWARDQWQWNNARGLFLQSQQSPEAAIWAMEEAIGDALLLEELWIQPGFLQKLERAAYVHLERPSSDALAKSTAENLLVTLTDHDELGEVLVGKLPEAWQFRRNRAFMLESGDTTVFVLACHTPEELERLKTLVLDTLDVLKQYDFHRGLAGVVSNFLHITPGVGRNPFELIEMARSLGCDWLSINGYNDWMLAGPVSEALREVEDPFLFVSGQSVTDGAMYGIDRYPDVQDNTIEQCLDWAKEKGGHYFANLSMAEGEYAARFQGYLVDTPEDVEKANELNAPFVTRAGDIERPAPPTMLAFLQKGTELTQESLFDAIAARQAVAVFPEGVIAGPERLRKAIQLLLLEGAALDERLGGPATLAAHIVDGKLSVNLENSSVENLSGEFAIHTGPGLETRDPANPLTVSVAAGEREGAEVDLAFTPAGSGRNNLVAVTATLNSEDGGGSGTPTTIRALATIKLPPVVSFHTLRYEVPGTITYPISLWNSSQENLIEFTFVVRDKSSGEERFRSQESVEAAPWKETRRNIEFSLEAGDYVIEASALGTTTTGQLAVREAPGEVTVHEEDLDGDGVPEIIMENDRVRVAVLMEGGRVIEYILKETGENIFFKLWPNTPPLHGTPGGTRAFYPYGGLEEFIGYPYIGGHIVYQSEVLQSSGKCARVRVWANMHGSKISKVYTLYAGGPVLEATYEFSDMTPTIQTIGINPLFELGPSTGPEDHYYFPEAEIVETRPELGRYYGRACFPKEGWAAGADPDAGVSLVIGYPVNDALYLHLWNNHPDNTPTPYYYTELQPWLQFNHGTTTYFSYYVLGGTEDWKQLAETFRAAGLVTERIDPKPWDY